MTHGPIDGRRPVPSAPAAHGEVSIVIVNWNTGRLLERCLKSIGQAPPGVGYEILVVDNASQDDSMRWLDSTAARNLFHERLRTLRNRENVGFARANNQAFGVARGAYLFLLNPDTEVRPGAIDSLVRTLDSDPRIGACAPRLLNPDGTLQPSAWGGAPWPWRIVLESLQLERLIPQPLRGELLLGPHWDHRRRRQVPAFSGAAVMARRRMIDRVGALDPRYPLYGEDVEWCLRINRGGWRLVFQPSAEVLHHGGQSAARRWSPLQISLRQVDAVCWFQRRCLSRWRAASNLATYLLVQQLFRAKRWWTGRTTEDLDALAAVYRRHLRQLIEGR